MSTAFETGGKVVELKETDQVTPTFKKREFTLAITDGDYTNEHTFELFNDACEKLDGVSVGDEIEIKGRLPRSRDYNGKRYSNHCNVWYIKASESSGAVPASETASGDDFGDVPF